MRATIHKQTYADGRAYRYRVVDEAGRLCYLAEPVGLSLPSPTRLVDFLAPDHSRVARLQPSQVARWRREKHYTVYFGRRTGEPHAVIRERWRLVDMLLLRLPRYDVQLGEDSYVVRGSRYGERFYEILRSCSGEVEQARAMGEIRRSVDMEGQGEVGPRSREMEVGQIERPTIGSNYIVQTNAAPLRQAPLVLAAVVVLIDLDLYA